MTHLIWLSTDDQKDLLSEWFVEQRIISQFYNLDQITSLKGFVLKSRSLVNQNFFAVDLRNKDYPSEQIVEAVQLLRRISASKIIFIVPQLNEKLQLLLSEQLVTVIVAHPKNDITAEMQQCIAGDDCEFAKRTTLIQNGMAARAKEQTQTLIIPDSMQLNCAVAGTMERIGATTQAIALCRYLTTLGFRTLLIDESENLWNSLQVAYPDHVAVHEGGYLEIDGLFCGVDLCPAEDFNARVFDLGAIIAETADTFCSDSMHMRLLVTGIKPWELTSYANAKRTLHSIHHDTLVSFGSQEELNRLKRFYGENTMLAPYQPIPLAAYDVSVFDVFLPTIRELCHAT